MTPDDIRKLAVCLPFAEAGHGLEETQAALIALADVVEACLKAYNINAVSANLVDALVRVEALKR